MLHSSRGHSCPHAHRQTELSSEFSRVFSPGKTRYRKMPLNASESPQLRHSRPSFLLRTLMNMLKIKRQGIGAFKKSTPTCQAFSPAMPSKAATSDTYVAALASPMLRRPRGGSRYFSEKFRQPALPLPAATAISFSATSRAARTPRSSSETFSRQAASR